MTAHVAGAGVVGRQAPGSRGRFRRRWRSVATLVLGGLLAGSLCGRASAAAPAGATRVEEDWVVILGTPDATLQGPQITTALSSTELLADVHMVFELNSRPLPDFTGGGMQLQCWSGDLLLAYKGNSDNGLLQTPGEVITYTTSMKITGGLVSFDVLNGKSTTWGTFGTPGVLRVSLDTPQSGLGRYSPDVSAQNSRVGFGGNMVQKFYMNQVRYYDANNNLLQTDSTQRVVYDAATAEAN